ncbi:MAG: proline--tRNA ligase [candidate division WOR-3 bacterium]
MKELPKKANLSEWYTSVCLKAELADYAPIRGCMVIRPYGFAIWEKIRNYLDEKFRLLGVKNCYFPIFIPESLLEREREHISGFAPQCAWVEKGGSESLSERLALRPTSEAIICSMFAKWVNSYRFLPVLINQWVNVIRWEKSTRLFLRTTEFLWQEGHTLHRTEKEAEEFALKILEIYRVFFTDFLSIPVLVGKKPPSEKFAGAKTTYTLEALMPDGQALQAGTSHNLGTNFSEAFQIKYLAEDNQEKYPYGTSWGISTRVIGALIMTHGDDKGLILPPAVAPIQIVIVPIFTKEEGVNEKLREKGENLLFCLTQQGFSAHFDKREEYSPGWKFNEWDLKGIPLRVEIGEKELKEGKLTIKNRLGEREEVKVEDFLSNTSSFLEKVQKGLYERAKDFLSLRTITASSLSQFKEEMKTRPGFMKVSWCGKQECEDRIRKETQTSPRLIPVDFSSCNPPCLVCQGEGRFTVYYARAY